MSEKVSKYQAAAADINNVLKPEPPLNATAADDAVKVEIAELIPNIKGDDKLKDSTWNILRELGWKGEDKPKKVAKPTPPAAAKEEKKAAKPAKAAKAEKKEKAPKAPKGPGVIATIVEILKKGKPVSKEAILDVLAKRFPDRDKESMSKTINVQIPNRISKEQKIKVLKNDKGLYYVK